MSLLTTTLMASTLLTAGTLNSMADVNVVASIKPVHSLVSAVMQGVGEPSLIVDGASSPHTYALKPSQAQTLQNADVVFWIGHELEAFLEKPLEAIASKAKTVELIDAHDLVKLEFREGGAFEKHAHDGEEMHDDHDNHADHGHNKKEAEHGHDDHDKETKAEHEEHDHVKEAKSEHEDHNHEEHAEHHDDHHGSFDPHVWLDPVNAKAFIHEIEETLSKIDPENAEKYEQNAKTVSQKIDGLITEVEEQLKPVRKKGFIVFHDAYQNFESRFGLTAVGSITVSPEVLPGAERINELQEKVKDSSASCVFSEPQFEPKIISTITEDTQARTGVLDPLGAQIENGSELYFTLIREMAASFKNCLSNSS